MGCRIEIGLSVSPIFANRTAVGKDTLFGVETVVIVGDPEVLRRTIEKPPRPLERDTAKAPLPKDAGALQDIITVAGSDIENP